MCTQRAYVSMHRTYLFYWWGKVVQHWAAVRPAVRYTVVTHINSTSGTSRAVVCHYMSVREFSLKRPEKSLKIQGILRHNFVRHPEQGTAFFNPTASLQYNRSFPRGDLFQNQQVLALYVWLDRLWLQLRSFQSVLGRHTFEVHHPSWKCANSWRPDSFHVDIANCEVG